MCDLRVGDVIFPVFHYATFNWPVESEQNEKFSFVRSCENGFDNMSEGFIFGLAFILGATKERERENTRL